MTRQKSKKPIVDSCKELYADLIALNQELDANAQKPGLPKKLPKKTSLEEIQKCKMNDSDFDSDFEALGFRFVILADRAGYHGLAISLNNKLENELAAGTVARLGDSGNEIINYMMAGLWNIVEGFGYSLFETRGRKQEYDPDEDERFCWLYSEKRINRTPENKKKYTAARARIRARKSSAEIGHKE